MATTTLQSGLRSASRIRVQVDLKNISGPVAFLIISCDQSYQKLYSFFKLLSARRPEVICYHIERAWYLYIAIIISPLLCYLLIIYLFVNYNIITNYILFKYKLSNFVHVLHIVSPTIISNGNWIHDLHANSTLPTANQGSLFIN